MERGGRELTADRRLPTARLFQRRLKQPENPLVLIRPARRLDEAVVFERVHGDFPVLLAELDQALGEAHGVLEVDVDVDDAVADQQRAFEPLGEVDRRGLAVGLGVVLRGVEDVGGVADGCSAPSR